MVFGDGTRTKNHNANTSVNNATACHTCRCTGDERVIEDDVTMGINCMGATADYSLTSRSIDERVLPHGNKEPIS